ncbi:hypothetical protein O0V09_16105 [Dasania sp. GY-19]|uniref:LysM domain-containing protein n=1 Tax=Dasania phycosphaerae TaxID=2950436 RepID=A0A9J6RRD9_9GAMM|nr:FimV/HubP family polar landmark protein [Dasania phycosphaerae]MCZ0866736.1 hypothetical protein [Dasania phycosphaerae]
MFNKRGVVAAIVFIVASATQADAPDRRVFENRYMSVQVGAEHAQTYLLQSIIEIQIPERFKTVGGSLNYLLKPYGFQIDDDPDSNEQYLLLMLALPEPHRQLGPVTLIDAITVLGGESFQALINPVKRTVRYQLCDGFGQFVSGEELASARKQWLEEKEKISPSLTDEEFTVLVKQGDSLSSIVNELDIAGITTDQTLVYLFQANPHAFVSSNMNYLLAGVTLTVPTVDPETLLTEFEASQFVDEHYRLWIQREVTP